MGVATKESNMVQVCDVKVNQFFLYNGEVHLMTTHEGTDDYRSINMATGAHSWIFCRNDRNVYGSSVTTVVEVISRRKAFTLLLEQTNA